MSKLDRRTFVEIAAAALLVPRSKELRGQVLQPNIIVDSQNVRVMGTNYSWSYSRKDDTFQVLDTKGRLIVKSLLQPAIVIALSSDPSSRQCLLGHSLLPEVKGDRVTFRYELVNGSGFTSVTILFKEKSFWIEPVIYQNNAIDDVVSVHYFAEIKEHTPLPSLEASFIVVPGICESPSVSPIMGGNVHLEQTISLGHGSYSDSGYLQQQWALPIHYFSGFGIHAPGQGLRNAFSDGRSNAFVCGLADLPQGDLQLDFHGGRNSLWIDYRSDLWKHMRGPEKLTLGSTLCWAFGEDTYDAISQYYGQLLDAGFIKPKNNSTKKTAIALTPQYCTWGTQVNRGKTQGNLDEPFLEQIYQELVASKMKAGMFSIDDKWEGHYGTLEHSIERFPHFEKLLDRIRADGLRIGLWTAFMRCEDPAQLNLTQDHMLKRPDGKPFKAGGDAYFILDFTQPEVIKVLTKQVRAFIRRYKPDLVKFDFGYELPALSTAAPSNKNWAGERLLKKGLDIVVQTMREENPDIVVMYYQLSPLFIEYFDLHSTDDLYLASGEYDIEANRRIYFSSLLAPLGVPTYGSSGYDWSSAPDIWFDSVAVGTLGSLNDFYEDEFGESGTPARIAKYNGLTHALRSSNVFNIIPFPSVRPEAPTRGAHSRSWARLENGNVVLIAERPTTTDYGDGISANTRAASVANIVESTAPIVIASRTADDITRSERLAVVPYGEGKATLQRKRGRLAKITTHFFEGAIVESQKTIQNGQLELTLQEKNTLGHPVEWMDIVIIS